MLSNKITVSDFEVYEALKTLQDYCKGGGSGKCTGCALSVGANPYECGVAFKGRTPDTWDIKEPEIYKAFS